MYKRAGKAKVSTSLPAARSNYTKSTRQADDSILGSQVFNGVNAALEEIGDDNPLGDLTIAGIGHTGEPQIVGLSCHINLAKQHIGQVQSVAIAATIARGVAGGHAIIDGVPAIAIADYCT